jgi:predicted ATPase
MRYDAVKLFVERARLRLPDFEPTPRNAEALAQICRMLEGIPLAIELAAARMDLLPPPMSAMPRCNSAMPSEERICSPS